MTTYQSNQNFLRTSLKANALFSVVSGLILVFFSTQVASMMFPQGIQIFGFDAGTILLAAGIAIAIFAAEVWLISRQERLSLLQAKLVVALDFLWVVASAVCLMLWSGVFSPAGLIFIIAVATMVAGLGLAELIGVLMTYEGQTNVSANYEDDTLTITATLSTDLNAADVWAVMRQQERYADVADNLAFVKVLSGSGEGSIRKCGDHKGNSWQETCTRWVDGEGFAFRVHTDALDYPYPIAKLSGDWSVRPQNSRSAIQMIFIAEAKPGLLNHIAFRLMATPFGPLCDKLLRNWVDVMKLDAWKTEAVN